MARNLVDELHKEFYFPRARETARGTSLNLQSVFLSRESIAIVPVEKETI